MLAGGVAHDLNNILSGSVGYADLLLRKIPEEKKLRQYLTEIRNSGKRAAAIVADLLTISRDAASARHTLSLNTIISEHLRSAEHQDLIQRFPEIKFSCVLDPKLANISCSEIHIRKCIMNLIINAAEATTTGAITITTSNKTITTPQKFHEQTIMPGNFVLLSINDTGSGIDAKDLEHIFEPFYSKKKLGRSGTGLGLAIVWNTILDHHGFIEILQPASGGSTFELYFPTTTDNLCPLTSGQDKINIDGHGEHILIVDDEETIRVLAKKLLLSLGYKVSIVSSGEEALSFLRTSSVDLLLLDMLMEPGMNGYQTFKQIKAEHPQQKALIASGFSETVDVTNAQALGAGAYLKKPYTLNELGIAIKTELQK